MGRALAPIDLRVIGKVFNEIASARWFEPNETRALAYYLIYRYSRGCDGASLKAQVEPFAREWFRIGSVGSMRLTLTSTKPTTTK